MLVQIMLMQAEFVQTALVITHILAGTTALIVAPVAMAVRKGGKSHKRWGWIFFWAMFVIFVSAVALLAFRPNVFLFIISILSFYAVFSGTRSLRRKRPERGQKATWLDWLGAVVAFLAGLSFILWGALPLIGLASSDIPVSFSVLSIAFGTFLAQMAWTDLRSFVIPSKDRNWWWYYHMDRMLSGYLAAVTAFMVQNVGPRLPESLEWTVWALPGLVGGIFVGQWIGYYKRKFAAHASKMERVAAPLAVSKEQ